MWLAQPLSPARPPAVWLCSLTAPPRWKGDPPSRPGSVPKDPPLSPTSPPASHRTCCSLGGSGGVGATSSPTTQATALWAPLRVLPRETPAVWTGAPAGSSPRPPPVSSGPGGHGATHFLSPLQQALSSGPPRPVPAGSGQAESPGRRRAASPGGEELLPAPERILQVLPAGLASSHVSHCPVDKALSWSTNSFPDVVASSCTATPRSYFICLTLSVPWLLGPRVPAGCGRAAPHVLRGGAAPAWSGDTGP